MMMKFQNQTGSTALLETARTSSARLVCGPVRPIFVSSPPDWALGGRFFELGPFDEGAKAIYVSTNNALVHAPSIHQHGWRFHPIFNSHGGEDEHFFKRAMDSGLKAVTSANAYVSETIPNERLNRQWLMQRHRRMGETIATIDQMNGKAALRFIKAAAWLFVGAFMSGAGLFLGEIAVD